MVVWIIGMSGAGKSTLGKKLYHNIKQSHSNTVFIDGDEIRGVFKHENTSGDYSVAERKKNAERITALCKWLDSQGINVVCCILSIFPEDRKQNRVNFSKYYEIYVSADIECLMDKRDYKGIYRKAKNGDMKDVVGVDITFPEPDDADVVIDGMLEGDDCLSSFERVLQELEV